MTKNIEQYISTIAHHIKDGHWTQINTGEKFQFDLFRETDSKETFKLFDLTADEIKKAFVAVINQPLPDQDLEGITVEMHLNSDLCRIEIPKKPLEHARVALGGDHFPTPEERKAQRLVATAAVAAKAAKVAVQNFQKCKEAAAKAINKMKNSYQNVLTVAEPPILGDMVAKALAAVKAADAAGKEADAAVKAAEAAVKEVVAAETARDEGRQPSPDLRSISSLDVHMMNQESINIDLQLIFDYIDQMDKIDGNKSDDIRGSIFKLKEKPYRENLERLVDSLQAPTKPMSAVNNFFAELWGTDFGVASGLELATTITNQIEAYESNLQINSSAGSNVP